MKNESSIGDIEFYSNDLLKKVTVKQYLHILLRDLWLHKDGFSSKRPFGNSGWEYEIYAALINARFIEGELDQEGFVVEINESVADLLVVNFIQEVFNAKRV